MITWFRHGFLSAALIFLGSGSSTAQTLNIPPELSLEQARELLLRHNPQLEAARLQIEIEQADVRQVSRYPNPRLSVSSEGLGSGGPGSFLEDQELSVVFKQDFLTGGKKRKRTLVQEADVSVAELEVRNLERLLLFDLEEAYFGVVLAQKESQLAGEILERFRGVVRLNRLRFENGEISGAELRRIEAAQYRFLEDQIRSEVNLRNSQNQMLALFGVTGPGSTFTARDDFDGTFSAPPFQELRQTASSNREDLAAQQARIRRSEAQTTLEKALARPDPSLFAGYRRDFGENGAIIGVEFPLFLFNRNQGAIQRGLAQTRQETSRLNYLQVEVVRELRAALTELDGHRQRIQALEGEYLQIAEQSRDISESAYRLGEGSLIELLEAERTYRETRLSYYRALFDFQIGQARLALAAGAEM